MKLLQLHSISEICKGRYHRGNLVVVVPYTAEAMTLVGDYLLMGSLCLSHHMLEEVVDEYRVLVELVFAVEGMDEG
jgi:hypothetical protein